MKPLFRIAAAMALSTAAAGAFAIDCNAFESHKPGYCGAVSNDTKCNYAAGRVPGQCGIAKNAVDAGFSINAPMPASPGGNHPIPATLLSAQAVKLLPARMVNGAQQVQYNGQWMKLVASGGGNYSLVASGAGN